MVRQLIEHYSTLMTLAGTDFIANTRLQKVTSHELEPILFFVMISGDAQEKNDAANEQGACVQEEQWRREKS